MAEETSLPEAVRDLLDGRDLADKIGETILLVTADAERWPRVALLSVGEVLAVGDDEIRLAVYRGSRTTEAMAAAGRALLVLVVDETTFKVELDVRELDTSDEVAGLRLFAGAINAIDRDVVGYATVTGGIRYELDDPDGSVERWRRQLDTLVRATEVSR